MKQCSFCNKESKYSCGYVKFDGESVDIQSCEKHLPIALQKQNYEANCDLYAERRKNFKRISEKQIIQSMTSV